LLPNQKALLHYRSDLEFNLNHENEKIKCLQLLAAKWNIHYNFLFSYATYPPLVGNVQQTEKRNFQILTTLTASIHSS